MKKLVSLAVERKQGELANEFGASDSALMLTLCALQMLVLLLLL